MTIVEELRQPARPLPLWSTLREAFLFVRDHRWHFGRLLIFPVALTTLLSAAAYYWPADKGQSVVALVGIPLNLAIFTFFAVSCHRLILLGEHAVPRWGVPRWSLRETRFFLRILAIYGTALFILAVGGILLGTVLTPLERLMSKPGFIVVSVMLGTPLVVCFLYIVVRLSFLLPAVAIDLRPTMESVWSQTERNGWRLIVLLVLIPVLLTVFVSILGWLIGKSSPETTDGFGVFLLVVSALSAFLNYATTAVEVAILSISFRKLSNWPKNSAPLTQLS